MFYTIFKISRLVPLLIYSLCFLFISFYLSNYWILSIPSTYFTSEFPSLLGFQKKYNSLESHLTSSFVFSLLYILLVSYSSCYNFKTKVKDDPFPYVDFNQMMPPNCSIICLHILRPKPIPWRFCFYDELRYPNSLNILCYSLFLIPTPVSLTEIFKYFGSRTSIPDPSYNGLEEADFSWSSSSSILSVILTIIFTYPF